MKVIILEIYPSINTIIANTPIYAFDKLDGSNIRAEWNKKTGFSKFGTRKRLLHPSEEPFGEAISLIKEKYEEDLSRIFSKQRFERATAYFEFFGENSFAGFHESEPHQVILFDVHVYKRGILPPKEYLKLFESKIETAPVLFEGKATQEFVDSVRKSELPGMSFEGVVCKGGLDNRKRPITFKVKSEAWLNRLKNRFVDDPAMFEKLK